MSCLPTSSRRIVKIAIAAVGEYLRANAKADGGIARNRVRRRHVFARVVAPPGDQIADLLAFKIDNIEKLAGVNNHAAPFACGTTISLTVLIRKHVVDKGNVPISTCFPQSNPNHGTRGPTLRSDNQQP